MSMATGFILMGVFAVLAGIGLVGLAIWVGNHDNGFRHRDDFNA